MAALGKLVTMVTANTAGLRSELTKAIPYVQSFGNKAKSVVAGIKSSFSSIGGIIAGAGLGLSLHSAVEAAADAERQQTKLASVLKATGNVTGFTQDQLHDYASELQRMTTFEDDATIGAMALLATFKNIQGPVFKDTIALAMDMSTIMGTDLTASMKLLGKALNDPTQGLSKLAKVGVQFSAQQKEMIESMAESGNVARAQAVILDALREKFGGAAQADAETMAGQIQKMKNAWGDFAETLGGKVAPALSRTAEQMRALVAPDFRVPNVANSAALVQPSRQKDAVTSARQEVDRLRRLQQENADAMLRTAKAHEAPTFDVFGLKLFNPLGMNKSLENASQFGQLSDNAKVLEKQMAFAMKRLEGFKSGRLTVDENPLTPLLDGVRDFSKGLGESFDAIPGRIDNLKSQVTTFVTDWQEKTKALAAEQQKLNDEIADIVSRNRTPLEKLGDEMERLNELRQRGLTPDTFEREQLRLRKEFDDAAKTDKSKTPKSNDLSMTGLADLHKQIQVAAMGGSEKDKPTKQEQVKQTTELQKLNTNLASSKKLSDFFVFGASA